MMKLLRLLSPPTFLSWYVLILFIIVIVGVILFVTGALRIYGSKSKLGRKNIFLLVVYRLLQLYFAIEVVWLIIMLSMQLFSFKPYAVNKRTGALFGLTQLADGYRVPVWMAFEIPKRQVSIEAETDGSIYTFHPSTQFSWAYNHGSERAQSIAEWQHPDVFGKNHIPYLRNETIQNLIIVNFPNGRPRLTKNNEPVISDTTVSVVPRLGFFSEAFIRTTSTWRNLILSLFTYLKIFSILIIVFLLLKILSSFRKEELFSRKNFTWVSYIGLTLMLYQVFKALLVIVCDKWVVGYMWIRGSSNIAHYAGNMSTGMTIKSEINISLFLTGFLIVLFAQVFKRGFMLQEEQQLTI